MLKHFVNIVFKDALQINFIIIIIIITTDRCYVKPGCSAQS